jgi:lysine 2,3-aminomutase
MQQAEPLERHPALASAVCKTAATQGREYFFPNVSDQDWNDWRWQLRHRVTTVDELAALLPMSLAERLARGETVRDFRMGITPYCVSLIDPNDPNDPILRQMVPTTDEYLYRAVGDEDPLCEEHSSPMPGITHRYPDRVLFVVSNVCAAYCRYCTRKRMMYEDALPDIEIDKMVDYIARTPTIRDVIVSGGDPLTFSTDKLESILSKLRAIPHVEIIRIGTRTPSTLPQRIDDELCAMLEKYHPIWINVHFSHPRECTPEAARACNKLLRAGVPLNSQTVLLKGVNDNVTTMKALMHGLVKMRVRPYYLYQCDPVRGAEHFRTTVEKGIEIIEGLRGHTSGLCVPTYVIDAPGGGGKIPIGPEYLIQYDREGGKAVLRNFRGKIYEYNEPVALSPEAIASSLAALTAPTSPQAAGNDCSLGAALPAEAQATTTQGTAGPNAPAGKATAKSQVVGKSKWTRRAGSTRKLS